MKAVFRAFMTTLALTSVPLAASAKQLDDPANARKVQLKLAPVVMKMDGVNGIGITGCDPKSGTQDISDDFVYCVEITTENDDAYNTVTKLYPIGSKVDGVFIYVENVGVITPEPRASAGN